MDQTITAEILFFYLYLNALRNQLLDCKGFYGTLRM